MNDGYELSEREIEIIQLVATGASNKEIAQSLVISPNTVKVHLRNIFEKLNVVSRTEATMVAIRMGWVESPKSEYSASESEISASADLVQPSTPPASSLFRRRWYLIMGLLLLLAGLVISYFLFIRNASKQSVSGTVLAPASQSNKRWEELAPLPNGLKDMGAARYGQYFYLIGGMTDTEMVNSVLIYDVKNNRWDEGLDMPQPASQVQAVLYGEKIYVPGGMLPSGKLSKSLAVYDPREDQWEIKSDLPYALSRYALASYEGKIYLFGGWDGATYRKEVLVYDPLEDVWSLFAEMPDARADFVAAAVGGGIHILGGRNEKGALSSHDVLFPQRKVDGSNPWDTDVPLPEERYGMNIGVLADMLYIVGGQNAAGSTLPVLQFLLQQEEWLEIEASTEPIGLFPAVISNETKLYVIGGEVNSRTASTNQVYQAVYTILVPLIR
jgi:DNA-binding CsgD family transcriptional regulator/N-acetylneuraminic acid mutarotase